MKKLKLNDKRVKNDDFEQVVECEDCGKLFWAISVYELGDWEDICGSCKKKQEKEQEEKEENIKKEGKTITKGGQIYAWVYNDNIVFNPDFVLPPAPKHIKLRITDLDDFLREKKKKGVEKITFHPYLFCVLLILAKYNGFGTIHPKLTYMGIECKEGPEGDYEYKIEQ